MYSTMAASKPGCPPCNKPCRCLPCDGGRIVEEMPQVEAPAPVSRIEYIPVERSTIEYEVRERIERIPRQRKVVEYREEVKIDHVPVTKEVDDFYAVEIQKQYVAQYKPKVEIQKIPVERVTHIPEFIPHERTRKILPNEQPELFVGEYSEHQVAGGRKGDWYKIDGRNVKENTKVTLADGTVVDGARFMNMIRSNPTYLESKLIPGDSPAGTVGAGTGIRASGSGGATYYGAGGAGGATYSGAGGAYSGAGGAGGAYSGAGGAYSGAGGAYSGAGGAYSGAGGATYSGAGGATYSGAGGAGYGQGGAGTYTTGYPSGGSYQVSGGNPVQGLIQGAESYFFG